MSPKIFKLADDAELGVLTNIGEARAVITCDGKKFSTESLVDFLQNIDAAELGTFSIDNEAVVNGCEKIVIGPSDDAGVDEAFFIINWPLLLETSIDRCGELITDDNDSRQTNEERLHEIHNLLNRLTARCEKYIEA